MAIDADARTVQAVFQRGGDGYVVRHVSPVGSDSLRLDLTVSRPRLTEFALVVAGPHSAAPQPWLYVDPTDVADWAAMLGIWLDEDLTGGATPFAIEERGGVSYLSVELYGLRVSDPSEHARLSAAAPSWFGDHHLH